MGIKAIGRGNKAPYQTTHLRVPLPLKPELERRIEEYRLRVLEGQEPADRLELLKQIGDRVKTDPVITRNGKDSGAVKRAVDALLAQLQDICC
jgi:hypothetical protein